MDQELTASPELPPLKKHPVYVEGRAHLDAGRWQQAFEAFQLLQRVYPDNAELNGLLGQLRMRATMAQFQPKDETQGGKRSTIKWVIAGTFIVIVLAVAAYGVYEFWINPVLLQELRVRQITNLRNEADEAIAAGDYAQARQSLQELQAILPEDPETIEALHRIERVENLSGLYSQAQALMDAKNWDEAVEVLIELQSLDAQYRDLPQLLKTAKESQALEQKFKAAEVAFAGQEWASAIEKYEGLHQINLTFRFEEIQARLFESHLNYGQALLEKAEGNPDQVTEALGHFSEALNLEPVNDKALIERRLAEAYLAALNSKDQDEVIELLQTIYNEQPNYAGNAAAQLLYARLLERASTFLESGNKPNAIADYQLAAQLAIEDPSEAQEQLTRLISEHSP